MIEFINGIEDVSTEDWDLRVDQLIFLTGLEKDEYPETNVHYCLIIDDDPIYEYKLEEISDQNLKDIMTEYNKLFYQYLESKDSGGNETKPLLRLRKIPSPHPVFATLDYKKYHELRNKLQLSLEHSHRNDGSFDTKGKIILPDESAREYVEFFAATTKFHTTHGERALEFIDPSSGNIKG